jgi:hypothetical protein
MLIPEAKQYYARLGSAEESFEKLCKRCGACCGALDDPCANLVKMPDGKFICKDYDSRLGPQKTVSGVTFNCVSIREHIKRSTLRPGCGYFSS